MALIRAILLAFLTSDSVKKLVVDLLHAYAQQTDNTIDDAIVNMVRNALFPAAPPAEPAATPEAPAE